MRRATRTSQLPLGLFMLLGAVIRRFFAGLELIDPGLVQLHRWRPDPGADTSSYEIPALAGVARKP